MLTPAATDPNRKSELKRQKENPEAFGTEVYREVPKDWNPQGGLVTKAITEEPEKEPEPVALIGSNLLSDVVKIKKGVEVQLGDIVQAAFDASGLSIEEWNALEQDEREQKFEAIIEVMKSK